MRVINPRGVVHELKGGLEVHDDWSILLDFLHDGSLRSLAIASSDVAVVPNPIDLVGSFHLAHIALTVLGSVWLVLLCYEVFLLSPFGHEVGVTTVTSLVVVVTVKGVLDRESHIFPLHPES
jgi:hypothetical protein